MKNLQNSLKTLEMLDTVARLSAVLILGTALIGLLFINL